MPDGGTLVFETENVYLDEEYCRLHTECAPGEYVSLVVSDTGSGMDKKVLGRIFEPFFTTRKPGEGTGLGLSMVFGIVKMHAGQITCYSEPEEGTTFKIYFPVVQGKGSRESYEEPPMPKGGPETILVVDDEPYIRKLAKRILERAGYRILLAATGQEALEIYRKEREKISLVLLDLIMPEMGGRQCLEELLKINPQVKALIASGFTVAENTEDFLDTAAKGSVSKPFNFRELLGSVRNVLDGI